MGILQDGSIALDQAPERSAKVNERPNDSRSARVPKYQTTIRGRRSREIVVDTSKQPDWSGFIRELVTRGEFGKFAAEIVLAPPAGYLQDAEKVFALGMNEGASLLCRASMEAAMYTYLYAEPAIGSTDPRDFMRLKKPGKKTGFETLYHRMAGVKVQEAKLLSASERTALWMIGQHGHSVAHIVERFHHSLVAALKPNGPPVDLPYPGREDIEQELKVAKAILLKMRDRLAVRFQEVASRRLKT